ncbi:MAG: DUF2213 domain-containing protein [Fibrobacter sp.]|nr:DUF2213 domain-containing protein [Fibrobacter sp.]
MNETLRDYNDFDQTVFRTTPEGYLTGKIRVTGAGVFSYMTADGIKRRLRPVKEVSSQDSIDSLNSKPVTLLHPMQDVSPENAKKLQVGFTGTDASWDGLNAYVTMTITDAEAIKEMREGRVRAVSCGYDAGLERGKGNWQGVAYDEAMKDIRYNHIALVREGRAGDGVRFRIGDSADFDRIFSEKRTAQNGPGENRMARKLIIDGAEYEADEKVIDTLHAAQKARDEAQQQSKALQGQLDSMTAARDAALSERDQLKAKAKDEDTINQLVNEKVALLDNAKKFGVEVKATDSVDSIRSALVKSAYPEMVLDGKSADYIAAAYDAAMIKLADSTSPKDKKSPLAPNMTHMADGADPEEAFQAMNKKYSEVSIKKEG